MTKNYTASPGPPRRRRKALRLQGFDYTASRAYFVTICTQDRECRFGDVVNHVMRLNQAGKMVNQWWRSTEEKFAGLRLDQWQIMPNHLHGILFLSQPVAPALPNVMSWYKTMTTNAYIRGVKAAGWPSFRRRVWQRAYHDRIIRNQAEIQRIRRYIIDNPLRWHLDHENPDRRRRRE